MCILSFRHQQIGNTNHYPLLRSWNDSMGCIPSYRLMWCNNTLLNFTKLILIWWYDYHHHRQKRIHLHCHHLIIINNNNNSISEEQQHKWIFGYNDFSNLIAWHCTLDPFVYCIVRRNMWTVIWNVSGRFLVQCCLVLKQLIVYKIQKTPATVYQRDRRVWP